MDSKQVGWAVLTVAYGMLGCGDAAPGSLKWGGDADHFTARGDLDGEAIDIEQDATELADGTFLCVLEYLQPTGGGPAVLDEIKIDALLPGPGGKGSRLMELELKDLSGHKMTTATNYTIVPRDDSTKTGPDELVVEWEWHTWDETAGDKDEELLESAARDGSLVFHLLKGFPEGGVPSEGAVRVGFTLKGVWSARESVELSITAQCDKVSVEEV